MPTKLLSMFAATLFVAATAFSAQAVERKPFNSATFSDGLSALAGHRRGSQATNLAEFDARRIISARNRASVTG